MKISKLQVIVCTFLINLLIISSNVFAGSTDAKPVASSSGSNINTSADNSQKSNNKTSAVSQIIGVANIGLGGVYAAKFASSCSGVGATCNYAFLAQSVLHFAMGAMSFQQAGANKNAAGQAGLTSMDSSSLNPYGNLGEETNYLDPNSNVDPDVKGLINTKSFMDTKRALTSANGLNGVKMDPKTGVITTPDGKTYDPSALTDKAAMSKAGFSDSVIDGAFAANAAFEKEAKKKVGATTESIGAATAANGYQDGGSGASYAGASSATAGGGGYGSGSSRNPASKNKVAGLTKNFNGEKIGVAAENIFNMMTRRFKVMEKRDSFFDPSELIPLTQ